MQIIKYIFPVQFLVTVIVVMTSIKTFPVDRHIAMEEYKSLYLAGVCLQAYLLFVVVRDYLISIGYFMRKDRDAFILVLLTHYFASCLDNLLMSVLLLWTSASLYSSPETLNDETVCPGGATFVLGTIVNVILAQAFVVTHVVALPIFMCCMKRKPALRELFQHA